VSSNVTGVPGDVGAKAEGEMVNEGPVIGKEEEERSGGSS
jgi:hypothetical protein